MYLRGPCMAIKIWKKTFLYEYEIVAKTQGKADIVTIKCTLKSRY